MRRPPAAVWLIRGVFLLAAMSSAVAVSGGSAVASSSSSAVSHASPKYCGKFTARNESDPKHPSQAYTLFTYIRRGPVTCTKTVRILKEWFEDRNHTQQYGAWFCEDVNGPPAEAGWVQQCTKGAPKGAWIADRFHRLK